MVTKGPIEKLPWWITDALTAAALDLLGEPGELESIRDWAEALTNLADSIEEAESTIQSWQDTEDREEKAD
jgi:hypothetical protein